MNSQRLDNLVLTCTSKNRKSGIISQLQKVFTVYALSRFLDVSYFHTPFQENSNFYPFNDPSTDPSLPIRFQQLFSIKSDLELPLTDTIIYQLPTPNLHFLCNLRDTAKKSDSFYIVEIVSARHIGERHPEMLHYIQDISPFESSRSLPIRIAMHLREGDLLEPELTLPRSFYVMTALQIMENLTSLQIPFVCELYVESSEQHQENRLLAEPADTDGRASRQQRQTAFRQPEGRAVGQTASQLQGVDGAERRSLLKVLDGASTDATPEFAAPVGLRKESNDFEEFHSLSPLKKWINHDPLETLTSLATADFLIMNCHPSSYFAALLNKKGTVLYHPFLKNPLPHWVNATNQDLIRRCVAERVNPDISY